MRDAEEPRAGEDTPDGEDARNGKDARDAVDTRDGEDTRDAVDRVVEAWLRERPDLDVAALEVFSRVTRLARHLERERRQAFAEHDLETWEFDVLAALRRAGPPYRLTPGQLVRETLVTSGTVTNRVDRLAGRGLVERGPDPVDRRGVLVQLTERGRDCADAALVSLLERERALLARLDPPRRTRLARLLRTVLAPFDDV